jgi:hypothetical protein
MKKLYFIKKSCYAMQIIHCPLVKKKYKKIPFEWEIADRSSNMRNPTCNPFIGLLLNLIHLKGQKVHHIHKLPIGRAIISVHPMSR